MRKLHMDGWYLAVLFPGSQEIPELEKKHTSIFTFKPLVFAGV